MLYIKLNVLYLIQYLYRDLKLNVIMYKLRKQFGEFALVQCVGAKLSNQE